MHIDIPHKFTQFEALQRVKRGLQEARPKLQDQAKIEEERWEDHTLHFTVVVQGQRITGSLDVQDKNFILDAKLPFLWRIFEGKIQRAIEEQVRALK